MRRADERMLWLLRRMVEPGRQGFIVAWDADIVDAFVDAFPEALRCLRVYTLGPHSSPMLNAAAQRAKRAGFIQPGHIGNQDARQYKQRTWCRCWTLTDSGRTFLENAAGQEP